MAQKAKKSTGSILLVGPPSDTAMIRYVCGFEAPDPIVVCCGPRRVDAIVSPLERGRAGRVQAGSRRMVVHTPASLGLSGIGRGLADATVRLLQHRRAARVRVSSWFPAHFADKLRAAGIEVDTVDGPLFPGRAVKTAEEILHITRAQRAAVAAAREAIRLIAEARIGRGRRLMRGGHVLTSESVRAHIEQVLLAHGCRGENVIVAGGRQAADPHERGRGPLRAGEAIVLDIFPRHEASGYWGDLTRTVARGPVPDRLVAMAEAVRVAQAEALARVAPRAACRTVHRAAARVLERHGFATALDADRPEGFIHGTGHGLGLEIHEPPSLREGPGRLRTGHVVTVEPGLYYPDLGGVRIEDTVAVTKDGARMLAPMARPFLLG